MNSRLEQLLAFLEQDPKDPFVIYAIATEYRAFDINKAKTYFERLLEEFPNYLPTYYHAAHLLEELDELEKAKQVYEEGIKLATVQQESLALRELQNAYNNLLFELDD